MQGPVVRRATRGAHTKQLVAAQPTIDGPDRYDDGRIVPWRSQRLANPLVAEDALDCMRQVAPVRRRVHEPSVNRLRHLEVLVDASIIEANLEDHLFRRVPHGGKVAGLDWNAMHLIPSVRTSALCHS
jgi:hypothetical protein